MSEQTKFRGIFEQGSQTYSNSARFFSPAVQEDVQTLYAFVRTADNYVDMIPQDTDGFYKFASAYNSARTDSNFEGKKYLDDTVTDSIIKEYIKLERRFDFDPSWTKAFLRSMEMDLSISNYQTIDDLLEYMYGSAAVIGLFMCRIIGLKPEAYKTAELLGNAFQYINFLRDVNEDLHLGRVYIPQSELERFGLRFLDYGYINSSDRTTGAFKEMMRAQVQTYRLWQKQAETGFSLIPTKERVGIKTASDMYKWTSERIANDPMIVYSQKVKPSKRRIFFAGVYNRIFG